MRADPFDPLNEPLWSPPAWLRWPAVALSLLGVTLVVGGLFSPGPTLAGFEKRGLARAEPAYGVLRITRHPFMWGVTLWAAGHLLANGERFALMLSRALPVSKPSAPTCRSRPFSRAATAWRWARSRCRC
jgi:uncharacterized membrane protein